MFFRRTKNLSYLLSVAIHLIFSVMFIFIRFSIDHEPDNYVTIGFGTIGTLSSSGAAALKSDKSKEVPSVEKQKDKSETEEKKIELPKSLQTDAENLIKAAANKKEKEDTSPANVKPLLNKSDAENKGRELTGRGEGNFGFEIDFGGKGIRKIYSYVLPEYPAGVSKEINVKLRFSILPDGTVGVVFPLIKADTRLEMAAINSLRQWRFEPLPKKQNQTEQTAIIVFPYRLQ